MASLKESLKRKLGRRELKLVPTSFDIVGDIAIFNSIPEELKKVEPIIAKAVIGQNSNIKVVLKKTKKYSGKYRTPRFTVMAGEPRRETVHKENGCLFKLDVQRCYFTPRLSGERLRIARLVKNGESVLVLFSGIGVYPCVIMKNASPSEVYGVEYNKVAHHFAEHNVKLNKLKNITLINGDVKVVLPELKKKFDRIVMPLPKDSPTYLDIAFQKLKPNGAIHLYLFSEENKFDAIVEKYKKMFSDVSLVKCGAYSPRVFRICLDLRD